MGLLHLGDISAALFFLFSSLIVGHWAGRCSLHLHAPQRKPRACVNTVSLLRFAFHASGTMSLNSSSDLFLYVDESFTFFPRSILFSPIFFQSLKSLSLCPLRLCLPLPASPAVRVVLRPPHLDSFCWPLLSSLKLLIDFLCHWQFFLHPFFLPFVEFSINSDGVQNPTRASIGLSHLLWCISFRH